MQISLFQISSEELTDGIIIFVLKRKNTLQLLHQRNESPREERREKSYVWCLTHVFKVLKQEAI